MTDQVGTATAAGAEHMGTAGGDAPSSVFETSLGMFKSLGRYSRSGLSPRTSTFLARAMFFGQILADIATVFAAYVGSHLAYIHWLGKGSPQTLNQFLLLAAGVSVVYALILDRVGLYRREVSLLNINEMRGILYTGFYAAAFVLGASFYFRSVDLSRITVTVALIATPIALYLQRQVLYRLHVALHQLGWAHQRVLIYGAGDTGRLLAKRLFQSPSLGYLPIGFLDDETQKHGQAFRLVGVGPRAGVRVLGGEELLSESKTWGIKKVFICVPSGTFERNQKLVEQCVAQGLDYAIVPNAYEKFIQNVELFQIGGIPMLRRRTRRVSFYYLTAKRLMDFILAAFFILILSPLLIVFSVLIKWNSKGPVIFKQKRVGLRGREFSFYKFRSMYTEAPKYARTPSDPEDPRITLVGRWLRRTSLDELPQLFNVLRGDMSLVGPRPEMPFIVETYTPLQRLRLEAKPGITGVWQISAARAEPIHANIEYDLFYLENRSLILDMAVIVKTILSVIKGVGAV